MNVTIFRLVVFYLALTTCFAVDAQRAQEGYPKEWDSGVWYSPSIGNVDGGDDLEIVCFGTGSVGGQSSGLLTYVFRHDGSDSDGWPINSGVPFPPVMVGDLDGDGVPELSHGRASKPYLVALDSAGEFPDGWPLSPSDSRSDEIPVDQGVLADLDGDGDLELVVSALELSDGKLYAFESDGAPVDGWPVNVYPSEVKDQPDWDVMGVVSLSAGDLDFDGIDEVVVGLSASEGGRVVSAPGVVLKGDGSNYSDWPLMIDVTVRKSFTRVSIIDIDGDGFCELAGLNGQGHVITVRHDGEVFVPPIFARGVSVEPAFADIDADCDPEMIVAGDVLAIYDFSFDERSELWEATLVESTNTSEYAEFRGVAAADIDGDSCSEILTVSREKDGEPQVAFHLLSPGLEELDGWPKEVDGTVASNSERGLCLADLDDDNDIEAIYTHRDELVVWDLDNDSENAVRVDWGMARHDSTLGSSSYGNAHEHFVRGDANGDGVLGLADLYQILTTILRATEHECLASLDYSDDGHVGILDSLLITQYILGDGKEPPDPYPGCDRAYRFARTARGCAQGYCD